MSGYFSSASSNSGSLSAHGGFQYSHDIRSSLPELRDRELQQITLRIMEKPLQGPAGFIASCFQNPHGLIGKHDYILLEIAPDQWIKAEKVGDSRKGQADAGIHLSVVGLEGPAGNGSVVRHEVRTNVLGPGHVRWTMAPVLDILTNHDPSYNLLAENCWKYAFSSAQAILNWCYHNALDWNVQCELACELDRIKHVERPMPRDVMHMVLHPSRPESDDTRQLLKQKWTHTVAHLPQDSFRRRTLSYLYKKV